MAKNAAGGAAGPKPATKSEVFQAIAQATDLSRKQVAAVFEELSKLIKNHMSKKGAGQFTVPGLLKITRIQKEATKAGTRPNPFKPGEMMQVKARPARNVVKVRALKNLKDMVK